MSATTMATTLSVRLNDDLEEVFEEYRDQHKFKPDKSVIIREALVEYLEREMGETIKE